MSETLEHTRLVSVIVDWVKSEYSDTPGFCLFCDCPAVLPTEKPSPIEGFFPDVCAASTPPAVTIVGEAKTLPDLESARSYEQLLAFLRFLAARPKPVLVVAVPWAAMNTARNIITHAKRATAAECVSVQFLTEKNTIC